MDSDDYWLINWLESKSITSIDHARDYLRSRNVIEELIEVASLSSISLDSPTLGDFSILAATGTDLSGTLTCPSPSCRRSEVDNLFRRAWHYFDSIIVDDVAAKFLSQSPEKIISDIDYLLRLIDTVIYLKTIGASSLVEFRLKNNPCFKHWRKHACEIGLGKALNVVDQTIRNISKNAKIEVDVDVPWKVPKRAAPILVSHEEFLHQSLGTVASSHAKSEIAKAVRHSVSEEVKIVFGYLTADLFSAAQLKCPVGATLPLHQRFLSACSSIKATDNVAFALELPVLANVPIKTLIKIRNDESEAFQRFRSALRIAAKNRLSISDLDNPSAIADEIRRDLIDPELQRIDSRLRSVSRSLAKKAASGISVGALATTCGLLAGVAPGVAILAGVTALCGIAGTSAVKNIDDREDIKLSDFYFLWKAIPHAESDY